MTHFLDLLKTLSFPILATFLGGVISLLRPVSEGTRSFFQHLAAGVVFAAVAGELLPQIHEQYQMLPVIVGFSLGVALMLLIRHFTSKLEDKAAPQGGRVPLSLVLTVGIDLLMDGLLIGIGFSAGKKVGLLLSIALTLELLFLGVAVVAELTENQVPRSRTLLTLSLLTLCVVVGVLLGLTLLAGLTGPWLVGTLAFGASALLYLVTEELLTEAHEVKETPLITSAFFLGFLALYVLENLI